MAESTSSGSGDSVGKISLDLEVTSDLANQIGKVSTAMGKKLKETMDSATKGMFDGMNESMNKNMQSMSSSLKSGLDKMKQNIRSTFTSALDVLKNIKMPSISFPKIDISKPSTSNATSKTTTRGPPKVDTEVISAQIDSTAKALDIVNAKIEQQQAKLAQLKETYANTFNESRKNALEEQILKTESAINGLISKSDKLGFKLADLDAKLASAGRGAEEAASKFSLFSKVTGAFGSLANGTANMTKKLGASLKSLGSSCNETNKHMNNMHYSLGNVARQFFTWMVVLPLVMKGLEAMTSFLSSALMSNTQFANSLNQVKSNLYTAFAPIYNAILPAINSLMNALATATAYIASFVNQLLGSTYDAGFKSAQNLQNSIGAYNQQEKAAKKAADALGSAGSAAKKAATDSKSGLAAFDEINKLSEKTPTPAGDGVITPITPMANMSPIEAATAGWVKNFKDILSKIFDPMVEAWNQEGKATMDAFKDALSSIWDLAKDIGSTFLDIWDNGTGVKVISDILKLLQTIFGIVGDIAKAFKTAWDTGDLGKQVVQALFNAFDSILKLLIDIGNTFRNVWNDGIGVEICTNILEILRDTYTVIGQIATSFDNAWNSGLGVQITTDILNLLNGCLRVIKDITASFSKAWETNGDTIATGILQILDDIVGTISDITNKWANAWENNGAGDTLMNSLLETLGKILTTIGDIGQGIRDSLGKAADTIFPTIIQFATDVSTGLGNIADGFKTIWDDGGKTLFDGIVQLIAQVAKLALALTGNVFKDFTELFKELSPAIGLVCEALGTVIGWIADFIGWLAQGATSNGQLRDALIKGWGEISIAAGQKWDEIKKTLSGKWGEITTTSSGIWDGIKKYINDKWTEVNTDAPGIWDKIRTTLGTAWTNISTDSQGIWSGIVNWLNTTFSTDWGTAWNNLVNSFGTIWDGLKNLAKAPINAIIGWINTLISGVNTAIKALNNIKVDIPDWIPEIGGKSWSLSLNTINSIPALATGGIIDSPTLAMVGEAGKEAVMPLENNTGWITNLATQIAGIMGASKNSVSASSSDSGDIIFLLDGEVLGKVAISQLRKMKKQGIVLSDIF